MSFSSGFAKEAGDAALKKFSKLILDADDEDIEAEGKVLLANKSIHLIRLIQFYRITGTLCN